MAHYNVQDADEFIPCPYNKSEMITVRRMPQHLIRCPHRKACEIEFETCPYNAIHIIPRADYRQHLTTCPARVVAEKAINYELEKQTDHSGRVKIKGCTDIPEYNTYNIQCSENWDDDEVDDVKPNLYQSAPSTVPDNVSEKSEMDSGIDVQDLSEVEFNDPEDRRSTRTHHGRYRQQNMPVRKPKQAPSVFQYSLRMAGVKQGEPFPGKATPTILQDPGIDETLASETFEEKVSDSKPLDVRPKVKPETQDMRPKVKHGTQDVRPKVKHGTQDVRPKVKHGTQDVWPKVKPETQDARFKVKTKPQDVRLKKEHERSKVDYETQNFRQNKRQDAQTSKWTYGRQDIRSKHGLNMEASDQLNMTSNSEAFFKTNKSFESKEPIDLQHKVRQNQTCDFKSNLDFPAENMLKKDVSLSEHYRYDKNLGISEKQPKMPASQLSPGTGLGRGAIIQYLISAYRPEISSHDPQPKALSSCGPLSPPQGIGRGALAQYILGKIPTDSCVNAKPSMSTARTSNIGPQDLGLRSLAQILSDTKVHANLESKVTTLNTSQEDLDPGIISQVHSDKVTANSEPKVTQPKGTSKDQTQGMLDPMAKENVPANSEPKEISPKAALQALSQRMLSQVLPDNKVPENSEPTVTPPKGRSQVPGRGMLAQVLYDNQRVSSAEESGPTSPKGPSQVPGRGMLAQVLYENQRVSSAEESGPTSPKGPSPDTGRGMLAQVLYENQRVSRAEESGPTSPKVPSQVPGRGMLVQVLYDNSVPSNPDPKVPRANESDDEEDFSPKFEGIGRGARLKNGNQDPRHYPPSWGSSWSNKYFEYAKN